MCDAGPLTTIFLSASDKKANFHQLTSMPSVTSTVDCASFRTPHINLPHFEVSVGSLLWKDLSTPAISLKKSPTAPSGHATPLAWPAKSPRQRRRKSLIVRCVGRPLGSPTPPKAARRAAARDRARPSEKAKQNRFYRLSLTSRGKTGVLIKLCSYYKLSFL